MATAPPLPASTNAPLDQTPPSPQMLGGGPQGQATPMSLSALAPGQPMGAGQMPPEILSGILQSAQRVESMIDAWAQVAPDLAMEFSMIKTQLAATLAKLVQMGAAPTSPTASGAAFPGGGMDRGISGAGAI